MIELALSPEEEQKRNQAMQMKVQAPQAAPLAQQEKGMGGQMLDMAKQRAMSGALNAGQSGITSALTSSAPIVASGVEGGAMLGAGAGGAGAMTAIGTAMPYVGAGLLAGKALGLFNQGGMVGPLSAQYNYRGGMASGRGGGYGGDGGLMDRNIVNPIKNIYNKYFPYEGEDLSYNSDLGNAQNNYDSGGRYNSPYVKAAEARAKEMGIEIDPRAYDTPEERYKSQGGPISYKAEGGDTMSREQAMALMNNQPEPMAIPMPQPRPINFPDPEELLQEMSMPQPRPQLQDPYGADRTYSPYDMIRPDNAPNT